MRCLRAFFLQLIYNRASKHLYFSCMIVAKYRNFYIEVFSARKYETDK